MPNIECPSCHQIIWVDHEDGALAFCCDSGDAHITTRDYLTNGCRSIEVSDELVNAYKKEMAEYRRTDE